MGPSQSPTSVGKPLKAFSCVRCFERKVKCDKQNPCAGCVRSNVECIFRVPPPPRRKKKRTQEEILSERLKHYEQILQQKGIDVEGASRQLEALHHDDSPDTVPESTESSEPQSQPTEDGTYGKPSRKWHESQLIYDEGRSHYVDNPLWSRVAEEFTTHREALQETSDSEADDDEDPLAIADDNVDFMLGRTPSTRNSRDLHPPPRQIMVLWQLYLENVDPVSKLIHRPTLQATLEKAVTDLDNLPKGIEALMFAIYSAAVNTIREHECESTLGEPKSVLASRYGLATKAALLRARFMGTTDIVVLQALVIHLMCTRNLYEPQVLWVMTGVAIRIAEAMGLHQDGTILGLPPFETEIRRRVWWHLIMFDSRSAELSGSRKFKMFDFDATVTKPPTTVNDEDIWPGMKDPPQPREGVSEMIFCALRSEFGSFFIKKQRIMKERGESRHERSPWENYQSINDIPAMDAAIDELERILEEKYVRYCNPTVPIQLMASIVARGGPATMRLVAHHPRRYAREEDVPGSERELLWSICTKFLEWDNMVLSTRTLQRFAWHTSFHFQWQAVIYVLDWLRVHPMISDATNMWLELEETFRNHPEFITNTKRRVHVAVGSLCLKAYDAREQALTLAGIPLPPNPPEYITKLRRQREDARNRARERELKVKTPPIDLNMGMQFDPTQQQQQQSIPPQTTYMSSQSSANQMHQQQPLPHFPAPEQQPAAFWYDTANLNSFNTDPDFDFVMAYSNLDNNNMDWSQWDHLLQSDFGATAGVITSAANHNV